MAVYKGTQQITSIHVCGHPYKVSSANPSGLQEGVDFRRAQWLVGDGSAKLYLGEVSNYIEFDADIIQIDRFGFVYGENGALRCSVHSNQSIFYAIIEANRIKNLYPPLRTKIKVDLSTHLVYSDGDAFAHTNLGKDNNDESAFKSAYFFGSSFSHLDVYNGNCSIGNVNMDGNTFTPCYLLHSIPASMDGNGIARQAGECGMYDAVSGKFFGNVANAGTFSVEGLVEDVDYLRYEWLKGDGSAYIDTLVKDITNTDVEVKYYITPDAANYTRILGSETADDLTKRIAIGKIYGNINIYDGTGGRALTSSNQGVIKLSALEGKAYVNGVNTTTYVKPTNTFLDNLLLFAQNRRNTASDTPAIYKGEVNISYFRLSTINLIPCKLLHSIPASQDTNNIARNEGECGMIDLTTGKFYGNVAASGSFSVEGLIQHNIRFAYINGKRVFGKLEEGVDYEGYDRLIMHGTSGGYGAQLKFADSPISLDGKIMRVNIGLNRIFVICTSPHYYLAIYSYGSSGLLIVRQWSKSDPNNPVFFQQTHVEGQELVVNFSTRKLQYGEYENNIISNETYAVQVSQSYYEPPHNSKTVRNFKIDGVINLTPCRLLRSIPAELDANGRARSAGECGMYDSVSGKFYGNVASSGTFSVENDEE